MIRLSLTFLVAFYLVLSFYGTEVDRTAGPEVARAAPPGAPLLSASAASPQLLAIARSSDFFNQLVQSAEQPPTPTTQTPIDEDEAVRLALAAGEAIAALRVETPLMPPPDQSPERLEAESRYVTGSSVNLRAAPSISAPILGQAHFGDPAIVLSSVANEWARIRRGDGTEAFIHAQFLSERNPA